MNEEKTPISNEETEEKPSYQNATDHSFKTKFVVQEQNGELIDAHVVNDRDGPPPGWERHYGLEIDQETLYKDIKKLLKSSSIAYNLAKLIESNTIERQEGGSTIKELSAEGYEALKSLARILPTGIPIKLKSYLKFIHKRSDEGLNFVLNKLILPNNLTQFYIGFPEKLSSEDGVTYRIPGLHKTFKKFAEENVSIILDILSESRGIIIVFDRENTGVQS